MRVIGFINRYVFGVGVPILLMFSGIFYCVKLKFFHFFHPIKVIKSLLSVGDDRNGVSSARAVTLALAGTLGVGNMVGVASAITLGGAGAVFWMWVSALVAMALKYAEIVLAMRHRRFDKGGRPHGSATYYILDLFHGNCVGVVFGGIFAALCILNAVSMGGMIQVNATADAMNGVFGLSPLIVGLVFALTAVFTLKKGTTGILKFTEMLVPFMTVGFIALSLAVIFLRPHSAAAAIDSIFKDAFSLKSGVCGIGGFFTSEALRYGAMRGIVSNEAGCGTAPAAHAVANCKIPARQGVWGIFEVFVDTLLLCTLTAIVILIGGENATDDMMLTINSYTSVLGTGAGYFLSVAVLCFGLATVICWGHYGLESVTYFSKKKKATDVFIWAYAAFVVLGAVISADMIWEIADFAIGAMTLINLFVLLVMSGEVREETQAYFWKKR